MIWKGPAWDELDKVWEHEEEAPITESINEDVFDRIAEEAYEDE